MITLTTPETMPSLGSTKLLTYSSSKIEKSNNTDLGYLTAIMYLAPSELSGWNVCSHASKGCTKVCLNSAGRGRFDNVQLARIKRTQFFFLNKPAFIEQQIKETERHIKKALKLGLKPAVRFNGTSDIPWERVKINHNGKTYSNIMELFPTCQFYDYTKYPFAKRPTSKLPSNYHLTFSRSEHAISYSIGADIGNNLENGRNVAVVFDVVPTTWHGIKVIDGDSHDMRFLDSVGVIVGLKAKGEAKKDTSGFVVRLNS